MLTPNLFGRLRDSMFGRSPALLLLPNLRAAISRVRNGTGSAILALVGDSVTAGWGSGIAAGPSTGGQAWEAGNTKRAKSWPQLLQAMFAAQGIPTRADAMFGFTNNSNTAAAINAYNPDLNLGSNWTPASVNGPAGGYLGHGSSTLDSFTFTPQVAADRFDFYTSLASGIGSFKVSDNSGTLATINEAIGSGTGFQKVTITRAVASTSPITITPSSSTAVYIAGIRPYNSTSPALELWNMGWPGAKASDWIDSSAGYSPLPGLNYIVPDIHAFTLELGANDANGSVSAASYQANMATLLGKLRSSGADCLLIKPHKASPTSNGYNVPAGYLAAIDALAAQWSALPAIDFNGGLSLVAADYFDQIHLSAQGYAKEAPLAFQALSAAL